MPSTEFDETILQYFRRAIVFGMALRVFIQGGNALRNVLKLLNEVAIGAGRIGGVLVRGYGS